MRLSQRAQSVAPFYAIEFGQRAAALEAQGLDVIKLSIGQPDFGAPPAVLAAARELTDGRPLPYTAPVGVPALREAIAAFYRDVHGVHIDPSRIIVTVGASAAMLLVTAALVDPEDEIIVGDPSYPCNREFLSSFGANVRMVPTDPSTRFQLSAAAVRLNWSEKTRGLMVAAPSNPTGTSIRPGELREICEWARRNGAWRIIDEIYLNLSDHDEDGHPPQTALSFDPDAIVINSFSKYFGMTGWRLDWCVVPDELVETIERLAQNYFLCPSAIAQQAALACFTPDSLAVCEERRAEFARRRAVVLEGLRRIGLPVPVAPDGAFYVYVDVSGTGMTSWQFCERALDEALVALTPGKDFGYCGADTFVRLSYAASEAQLKEAIRRLGQFVDRLATDRQTLRAVPA